MLKPRTLMVPILLVPSLGVFSFLIGLPSEAFADAGGWFHPPVEYTSTVEADNELGNCSAICIEGASDHMDQNMACCSACAFVTGRIVKKANNYIDRLHWYRIVAAIVSFVLGTCLMLRAGVFLSQRLMLNMSWYVGAVLVVTIGVSILALVGEIVATKNVVPEIVQADRDYRALRRGGYLSGGSCKRLCSDMIEEYGPKYVNNPSACSREIETYQGAYRRFGEVNRGINMEGQIQERVNEITKFLQTPLSYDAKDTPKTPDEVWKYNDVLNSIRVKRMSLLRFDLAIPLIVLCGSTFSAWVLAIGASWRRRDKRRKGLE